MLALTNGTIATSDFPVSLSILALVMVIAGGEGTSLGPLLGAALFTVIQAFLQQEFGTGGQWPILIYGLFLVVIVAVMPRGIVGGAEDLWRLVGGADRARPGERPDRERRVPIREGKDQEIEGGGDAGSDRSDLAALLAEVGPHESAVLEVEGIHKTLGGVNAVQGASIAVRSGEVVGLIGPNGSGKTTLLNCISGFLSVNSGTVRIDSRNLARAASLRARAGIGRTFQHPVLFTTESAAANVLIGVDRRNDSTWVSAILRTPSFRRKARADEAEARAWLDAVGLGNTGNTSAGKLPPGQQRLLEVARALACRPRFLLMDEPAATLRESEVRDLATMIREAAGSGIGILLVDHNVEFIMSLCDRITVIAAGEVIAAGTPSEIRADAEVINVYLGHGAAERNVGERRVES